MTAFSPHDVWADGTDSNTNFPDILHFDGNQWVPQHLPIPAGYRIHVVNMVSPAAGWALVAPLNPSYTETSYIYHFSQGTWQLEFQVDPRGH